MRGIWGCLALLVAMTGLACQGKAKRLTRQPQVQIYELPSPELKQFDLPPTYPDDRKPFQPSGKKDMPAAMPAGGGMRGPGAGGPGAGGPGGGGFNGGGGGGGAPY